MQRECKYICGVELPTTKCGCWSKDLPYLRDNHVDVNKTMRWCSYDNHLEKLANGTEIGKLLLLFLLSLSDTVQALAATSTATRKRERQKRSDTLMLCLNGHALSRYTLIETSVPKLNDRTTLCHFTSFLKSSNLAYQASQPPQLTFSPFAFPSNLNCLLSK